LISSIALIGVMIGLLLQARQLRANNVQTFKGGHIEALRIMFDYPDYFVDLQGNMPHDTELFRRQALTDSAFQHLNFGYSIKTIPETGLRHTLSQLFAVAYRREWWEAARDSYVTNANSRRERQFIKIVDQESRSALATDEELAVHRTATGPL
jgi:hypothetical protein